MAAARPAIKVAKRERWEDSQAARVVAAEEWRARGGHPDPEDEDRPQPWRQHGGYIMPYFAVPVPRKLVDTYLAPPPAMRTLAIPGQEKAAVRLFCEEREAWLLAGQQPDGGAVLTVKVVSHHLAPYDVWGPLLAQHQARHASDSDPAKAVLDAARAAIRQGWRGYEEATGNVVVINPAEVQVLEANESDVAGKRIGRGHRHQRLRLLVSGAGKNINRFIGDPNFGILTTPYVGSSLPGIVARNTPWALDNGGYKKDKKTGEFVAIYKVTGSEPADKKFLHYLGKLYKEVGPEGFRHLLFVSVPDVPGDAATTNQLWLKWANHEDLYLLPRAYVAQDGCEAYLDGDWDLGDQAAIPWNECDAIFIGGTTAWKLGTGAQAVINEAKRRGKYVHIGRVNSPERLAKAWSMGADSIDGSSMSYFPLTKIPVMLRALRGIERKPIKQGLLAGLADAITGSSWWGPARVVLAGLSVYNLLKPRRA